MFFVSCDRSTTVSWWLRSSQGPSFQPTTTVTKPEKKDDIGSNQGQKTNRASPKMSKKCKSRRIEFPRDVQSSQLSVGPAGRWRGLKH